MQDVTPPTFIPHGRPITHSSTGSKPDSPVHHLFPRLFLALDFVCNSRTTCLVIYAGIRRNAYSDCSKLLSHFVSGNKRIAYALETSHGTFLLGSRYIFKFQIERHLCFFPELTVWCSILLGSVLIEFFPSYPFVSTVKFPKEGRQFHHDALVHRNEDIHTMDWPLREEQPRPRWFVRIS